MKNIWNTNLLIVNAKDGKVNKRAMQEYNNLLIAHQESDVMRNDVVCDPLNDFVYSLLELEGLE